jgi:hypothetical protein
MFLIYLVSHAAMILLQGGGSHTVDYQETIVRSSSGTTSVQCSGNAGMLYIKFPHANTKTEFLAKKAEIANRDATAVTEYDPITGRKKHKKHKKHKEHKERSDKGGARSTIYKERSDKGGKHKKHKKHKERSDKGGKHKKHKKQHT